MSVPEIRVATTAKIRRATLRNSRLAAHRPTCPVLLSGEARPYRWKSNHPKKQARPDTIIGLTKTQATMILLPGVTRHPDQVLSSVARAA